MFTWDTRKAIANYEKHGVSYEKAATVFADANGLGWEDMEHSAEESRLKQLGTYLGNILLIV